MTWCRMLMCRAQKLSYANEGAEAAKKEAEAQARKRKVAEAALWEGESRLVYRACGLVPALPWFFTDLYLCPHQIVAQLIPSFSSVRTHADTFFQSVETTASTAGGTLHRRPRRRSRRRTLTSWDDSGLNLSVHPANYLAMYTIEYLLQKIQSADTPVLVRKWAVQHACSPQAAHVTFKISRWQGARRGRLPQQPQTTTMGRVRSGHRSVRSYSLRNQADQCRAHHARRDVHRAARTRVRTKDLDLIQNDLLPENRPNFEKQPINEELPGLGQHVSLRIVCAAILMKSTVSSVPSEHLEIGIGLD